MTVIVAILGLIFLIVIHELGHMLTAKALGVRVPEFGVGFGPALVKKKFGKTVYSFRIVLLGGFAKMAGMGDGAEGPDTYYAKASWRRALIILAGPAANLFAAVAILACVYMFQGVVTDVKPVVSEVEQGSMAQEVGIERGDRIVGLDGGTGKDLGRFRAPDVGPGGWREGERDRGARRFTEDLRGRVGGGSRG